MISADQLAVLLPDFLPRQRWYAAGETLPSSVEVIDFAVLRDQAPGMVWALARTPGDHASYQVVVGLRPLAETERFLEGKGRNLLGDVDTAEGPMLAYDALVDPELVLEVFALAAPGEPASTVRALNVEQSNTSVVVDERHILKLFRRVHDGPNPDAELADALGSVGFASVPRAVATWQRGGRDLAVVREFLGGGSDGWHLALTSLRDLYDRQRPPAECGGDFAPEARRLGEVTALLHIALAESLGTEAADAAAWAETMRVQRDRYAAQGALGRVDEVGVAEVEARLAGVGDPGVATRIHGDYHLGQVLRTDAGWFVLDFEGEPKLPVAERRVPSSALRDVAGMLRSFHYASQVGLREHAAVGDPDDPALRALAAAWEDRNVGAFLAGYLGEPAVAALLPATESDTAVVLDAFVLAKAVYEVAYEHSHRPEWATIPIAAIERILAGGGAAPRPSLADDPFQEE